MGRLVFSSESVTEGHPDKVADRISDSILDAYLRKDAASRVACESLVATEFICVAGEISSTGEVDHEHIARRAIKAIGYDSPETGIGWDTAQFTSRIVPQSAHIAQGVVSRKDKKIGAGDQGLMFGYAQANLENGMAPDFMPIPISLAHGLTRRLTELRHGKLSWLRPDGKSQVSVRYEDGHPVAVDAVVLAAQHSPDISQEDLHAELREHCIDAVIPEGWLHKGTKYFINHTGKFEIGGPKGDCGLTGRKIIVDTYGGWIPHGGGAFSGKDPTKVDRSAAYFARYAAKNLVAAGLCAKVQIQVAYSIGSLQPVSIAVESFGTATVPGTRGKTPDEALEAVLRREFDFSPGAIIEELRLRRPLYTDTSAYGHFGRPDLKLPWEDTKRAKSL
ncbi:MAG: S-adenosylmethionine synthetase [Thermoplasmata archaeon]|jgi:S-adenosylmethionine synthetase|nr:S-adenosylmethionine synthetase [Thermoplasmata archaeon]